MNKVQAYLGLFLFSALVMFIEIIGAKMLTPILGGSQTVWISQILVTLLSLAVGGALSSLFKNKKIEIISLSIFFSAIYLIIVLLLFNNLSPFYESLDFLIASLLYSITLYTFPLISLGMVFPTLYIILEKDFKQNLGKVYFIGTVGSTVGTILTYFSVYFTSNLNLLLIAALCQITFILFINYNQRKKYKFFFDISPVIPILLIISLSLLTQKESSSELIYYSNSHFGEVITIKNSQNEIIVSSDGIVQNGFNQNNQSIHLFSYALERIPFYYKENIRSTLMIGFGVGAGIEFLKKKNQKITAVEINPTMIELTTKIFPENIKDINLSIMDGRVFLKKNKEKYDSILLDCFLVDFVPKYLLTKESFKEIKKSLNNEGILTINSFGIISPHPDVLTVSLYTTLKSEFKNVKVLSTNQWNVFFVASNSDFKESTLDTNNIPSDLSQELKKLISSDIQFKSTDIGLLLEDKSSKIDFLDNIPRNLYRKKHKIKF